MRPFIMGLLMAALFSVVNAAQADEKAILARLRSSLDDKPSAVRPSLLPGLYGVYYGKSLPRAYVDENFRFLGNSWTGYQYLSGPKRGKNLTPDESRLLLRDFIADIPRDRLIKYQYGKGRHVVYLITAFDCPSCRALEAEMTKRAKQLDATVYVIPTALSYEEDPGARRAIRDVLCSSDRATAWHDLLASQQMPVHASDCWADPDLYAFIWTVFPVHFPSSVPTLLTADGRIYSTVLRHFDEAFGGR